jgi:hypothetical protein
MSEKSLNYWAKTYNVMPNNPPTKQTTQGNPCGNCSTCGSKHRCKGIFYTT